MRELREILERARAIRAEGRPAALATVVAVEGSSYRREGARMLLEPGAEGTGVLSGGCLEQDLQKAALEVIASSTTRTVVYDLRAEEEAIWGFGLGCAGKVTLLVEPVAGPAGERLECVLGRVLESRREVRLATAYESTPPAGARAGESLLLEDSETPDPTLWTFFAFRDLSQLREGEARTIRFESPEGGSVSALLESILPPPHLVVLGGERDVSPLLRLGGELGWATTAVVARPSAAAERRLGSSARFVVAAPRDLCTAGIELSPRTALVVATHRYLDDLAYLGELASVGSPLGYLAVLGPAARRERLLADLAAQGHAPDALPLAALRGPAGLALGGRSPGEVALSIVAEVQATLAGASGAPLSAAAAAWAVTEVAPR
jgi:xanthine/CO dehydrogenase XdhC/CoxF family maturation factor